MAALPRPPLTLYQTVRSLPRARRTSGVMALSGAAPRGSDSMGAPTALMRARGSRAFMPMDCPTTGLAGAGAGGGGGGGAWAGAAGAEAAACAGAGASGAGLRRSRSMSAMLMPGGGRSGGAATAIDACTTHQGTGTALPHSLLLRDRMARSLSPAQPSLSPDPPITAQQGPAQHSTACTFPQPIHQPAPSAAPTCPQPLLQRALCGIAIVCAIRLAGLLPQDVGLDADLQRSSGGPGSASVRQPHSNLDC